MEQNNVQELTEKVNELTRQVENLTRIIKKINTSCDRMDNHISFVEHVYETLKKPLKYLSTKSLGYK